MNKQERCRRLLAWLETEYPCGRAVVLRWRAELKDGKHQLYGWTLREGNKLEIYLSKKTCDRVRLAEDTLIHEYTHCILWGPASLEWDERARERDHKGAFWSQFGEISDRYYHEGGKDEALQEYA